MYKIYVSGKSQVIFMQRGQLKVRFRCLLWYWHRPAGILVTNVPIYQAL